MAAGEVPLAGITTQGEDQGDSMGVMAVRELLGRVTVDPGVCGGQPCVRGTRIAITIVLDALAEGLTEDAIIDHYPTLIKDDIRAAVAYAAELARENVWKITAS